ncbi:D-alanyl-D-alanine carboxypeptidase/D-alanyl-D-alanine-endopeptidase, partial [Angustibacter aerolatus]
AAPRAAAAATTRPDSRIAGKLAARGASKSLGSRFSGAVIDVATDRVVWQRGGSKRLMPASTTKLVTATNALAVYGADHRFTTTVRRGSTWSSVVLVGAGDPTLSGADLTSLAKQTAAKVKAQGRTSVAVRADDSLFPTFLLPKGWKASYVNVDVRPVRALVVDQHHANDTTIDAAKVFAGKLRTQGLTVTTVKRAQAPAGSPLLGSVAGDTLGTIVSQMLLTSDNDHAEALNRLVSLRYGTGTTWTRSRIAQRAVLAREGTEIDAGQLFDGSGLSRADRLSALQLARVVDQTWARPELSLLRGAALPTSGRTGTLQARYGRFDTKPSKCAAGKVHAKTGTLGDAVALAGWTTGTDGRRKAFAFLVNGRGDGLALKRKLDTLAATVTGCY